MAYQQLVEPNLDPYIHVDGAVLTDWLGWCLAYVRTAFGTPFAGSNAWQGWESYAVTKHGDRSLPAGVFVPVWFSGAGGLGHVAIYKDGQVWSSPWHHKPTADVMPSIAEVERIYGVSYVGWSEGLGGVSVVEPVPEPMPVVVHPYTIENITTKQVRLNKNTHLWGLNYDNFTAINANPQADAVAGTVVTVNAILHHNIGYNYYLSDPSVASGYNMLDCDDVPPPPPVPQQLPTAPLSAPSDETYDTIKDLDGYITSNQAINHDSPKVTIPSGTYFVFNKRIDNDVLTSVNLTKTPGIAGAWINTADNSNTPLPPAEPMAEPEPAPEPEPEVVVEPTPPPDAKPTYEPLPKPEVYMALADIPLTDLTTGQPLVKNGHVITMPKFSVVYISGTTKWQEIEYVVPKSAHDKDLLYGIELVNPATKLPNIELESVVLNSKTTLPERKATKTLKPIDRLLLAVLTARKVYLVFTGFLGRIRSDRKNKNK